MPEELSQALKKTLEKTSSFIGRAYRALPETVSQAVKETAEKTVKFAGEAVTTISETSHKAYNALPENVTQTIETTAEVGGALVKDIAEAQARRDSEYRQTLRDMGVPAETAANIVRYKNDALEVASDAFDVVTSVVPIVGGLKGIKLAKKLSKATNASRTVEALDLQSTAKAVKSKSKKRPHTWEAREGQEWKQKIFGKGQNTGTPGHALQGYRDAIPMAKSDEYEAVYLNLGIKGILKRHGLEHVYKGRNRIPDVTGVRKNKKIDLIETRSKTDRVDLLNKRMDEIMDNLPKEMYGKTDVKEIKGFRYKGK